jgi:uncharacterized integral membrane protein
MQKLSTGQIINIILILLVIIFIGQNLQTIEVKFLFFNPELPLIVIILLCLVLGYVSAIFLGKKKKPNDNEE